MAAGTATSATSRVRARASGLTAARASVERAVFAASGAATISPARAVDPYSSALWFDGWKAAIRTDAPWLRALAKEGRPTADPHTWLLAIGWRRGGGLIDIDDVPGPAP